MPPMAVILERKHKRGEKETETISIYIMIRLRFMTCWTAQPFDLSPILPATLPLEQMKKEVCIGV